MDRIAPAACVSPTSSPSRGLPLHAKLPRQEYGAIKYLAIPIREAIGPTCLDGTVLKVSVILPFTNLFEPKSTPPTVSGAFD